MTVGEALAEARHQAGLSVEELSERTKIRGTVIRGIEQDDYQACGGDLYVRGYVRVIAGAVGIDAQPLIREFDIERAKGSPATAPLETAQTSFDLPAVTETPSAEPPAAQQEPVPPADVNATRYDIPAVTADPAVTSYDLPPVPRVPPAAEPPTAGFAATQDQTVEFAALIPREPEPVPVPPAAAPAGAPQTRYDLTAVPVPAPPAVAPPGAPQTRYDLTAVPGDPSPTEAPEDLMAAGYDLGPPETPAGANAGTRILPAAGLGQAPSPAVTAWPAPGPASAARKSRRGLIVVAAAVAVVAVGALGFSLASRGASTAASAVPSANASAAAEASAAAAARDRASASAAAQASASAAERASASAAAKAEAKHVVSLPVVSVVAFGPDGTADGDNPASAAAAVAAEPSRPWTTQWYTTAEFGKLKHGTGLLLDLGGKVTVTTVRLVLSPYRGADLQLRVGNAEELGDLQVAATAYQVGGTLNLALNHPAAARYLLIWFTELPPNGAGRYQEAVSHVSVAGRR